MGVCWFLEWCNHEIYLKEKCAKYRCSVKMENICFMPKLSTEFTYMYKHALSVYVKPMRKKNTQELHRHW